MRPFLLGILLSFNAQAAFFIESLDLNQAKSLDEIYLEIDQIAAKKKHLISLGESHLHAHTALAVAQLLIERYVSVAENFRFCSETINSFLTHSAGQLIQEKASDIFIGTRNSPSYTDFRDCRKNRYDGYFTYSGFFHQLPFARPYPLEFTPTRVITEDGESIRDQMNEKNALYIAQMELEFIELVTQARLLRNPPLQVQEFRAQTAYLSDLIQELKTSMETLLPASLKEREKKGSFIPHTGAYLLVTDLAYRLELMPLPLLTAISNLDDAPLEILLSKLAQTTAYVTAAIQEPDENGQLYQTGYGTIPWLFPASTTFMEMRIVPGENLVMTAAPGEELPTCIAYKNLGPSIVECNYYLSNLP